MGGSGAKLGSPMSKEEKERNIKLSESLKKIESGIYNKPKEEAYILSDDGNVEFNKGGKSYSVDFTPEEEKKMWGKILTHNHPDGFGFSLADVDYFINKGLKEIRAVGINGKLFSLKRTEYNSPQAVAFLKAYTEADERFKHKAYNKAHKEYDNGTLKHDSEISPRIMELWDKSCNTWLKNNAKKYGMVFSEKRL